MPTVLVADDDQELLEMFRTWLDRHGEWSVRAATTGEEAAELLDGSVDVAILDRRMPGRTGDEVARTVLSSHPESAVVMISAFQPDDGVEDVDYDRYLTKPVHRDELIETVERALGETVTAE